MIRSDRRTRVLWTKRFRLAGASLASLVAAACGHFLAGNDDVPYVSLMKPTWPWKAFALGQYGLGDEVAPLLARLPPTDRETAGAYETLSWTSPDSGGAFVVETRDGRIVSAWAQSFSSYHEFCYVEPDMLLSRIAHSRERKARELQRAAGRLALALSSGCELYFVTELAANPSAWRSGSWSYRVDAVLVGSAPSGAIYCAPYRDTLVIGRFRPRDGALLAACPDGFVLVVPREALALATGS